MRPGRELGVPEGPTGLPESAPGAGARAGGSEGAGAWRGVAGPVPSGSKESQGHREHRPVCAGGRWLGGLGAGQSEHRPSAPLPLRRLPQNVALKKHPNAHSFILKFSFIISQVFSTVRLWRHDHRRDRKTPSTEGGYTCLRAGTTRLESTPACSGSWRGATPGAQRSRVGRAAVRRRLAPQGTRVRIAKEGGRSKLPTGPGRPSSTGVRIPLHVHNRTLLGCRGTLCTGPRGQYSIGTANRDSGTRVAATSSGSCDGGRALGEASIQL